MVFKIFNQIKSLLYVQIFLQANRLLLASVLNSAVLEQIRGPLAACEIAVVVLEALLEGEVLSIARISTVNRLESERAVVGLLSGGRASGSGNLRLISNLLSVTTTVVAHAKNTMCNSVSNHATSGSSSLYTRQYKIES